MTTTLFQRWASIYLAGKRRSTGSRGNRSMAVTCSGTKGWAALGVASAWAVLVAGGIAGCSTALTPAPITDMSPGGNGTAPERSPSVAAPVAGPLATAPAPLPEAGPGFYRVKPGDTLY